jgi:NADPH:quinone reductase-like Zn-dependent oxidoreductase
MNETVKVIRFYQTGGSDVLRIDETQLSRLEENEVLVRVQAVALSRLDLLWRAGSYFEEPDFPAQIGYDAAGVVESVGPEVKTLKVGDRVSTFPAVSLLDYAAHGERIVYPETALMVYPENLTPVQAAAANTGLFTAYFALLELADLKRDQQVVVTAASSSMGIAAIQMARAIGAKSIAVTRSEAKKEALLGAGADQVIIAGREDVQETILELTEGLGAEVIYDAVAGPGLEELVWATKRFGHVIVYGHLGVMECGTLLPLGACFLRAIQVHNCFRIFDFTGHPRLGLQTKTGAVERAKKFIFDGLASKLFSAKIDRVFFGLDEYAAAHRYMETNDQIGKIAVALSNEHTVSDGKPSVLALPSP